MTYYKLDVHMGGPDELSQSRVARAILDALRPLGVTHVAVLLELEEHELSGSTAAEHKKIVAQGE